MLYQRNNMHGGRGAADGIQYDFSANVNPFGTPPEILEAIETSLKTVDRYPDPACRDLVCAIAESQDVPESYVLCGNGAAELIYLFCMAERPMSAVVTAPTFSEYAAALTLFGTKTEHFLLSSGNDFLLDFGFVDFLNEKKPNAVMLCNPNNPTGRLIPMEVLENILVYCNSNGIRLFIDECFLDLTCEGKSMKDYLTEYPCLFILKAFTKSYGLAGIRLGYCMCSDNTLLKKMSEYSQPWNVSGPAQAAGIAAVQAGGFVRNTAVYLKNERVWLKERLEAAGLWVCPSNANYLLFCGPDNLADLLCLRGIAVRKCDNYSGLGKGWYRTAVRTHEENVLLASAISEICENG